MAADAERDLLFGLLALQNGLIDQGQLVSAFQAWTRDKSRPLADHLVGRGDLDADERSGVEAMVALHLKKHGDAVHSLAAVVAGRSTREGLLNLGDPDIEATMARLGTSSIGDEDGHFDADRIIQTYDIGMPFSADRRFRVLRPHARGGLGAVFVALDAELNREVALKRILDGHADDPVSRQRFMLEAEITGGLEHPGIVPVYGLGTYGDGRPYYAMRFIRGDSLKEAIVRFHRDAPAADPGARSLALRQLLRRFTDVCNAIDYAHSRGVLHRDIKPGNIIVGKHGETLVVDWGLAKALGHAEPTADRTERTLLPSSASGSAETLPGQAMGTPAYMSPEQARGDLAALGPRSDVYSLGATLYSLMTGNPPFKGGVADVLRAVERGEFRPPRALDPWIDPALEAICLKAMALAPDARHASARAIAEDLESWMADEPVSAYPEPRSRRLARWARHHRPLVAGAAALMATAVVALSLSTWLISRQKARVERARLQLAIEKGRVERAREDADAGYGLARSAVDRMFRDVINRALINIPEMGRLRVRLADEALVLYRQLRDRRPDDPEATFQLARAEADAAFLQRMIGNHERAATGFSSALDLLKFLIDRHPDRTDFAEQLCSTELQAGELRRMEGRYEEARPHYRNAVRMAGAIWKADPGRIKGEYLLGRAESALGGFEFFEGRFADSEQSYGRSVVALKSYLAHRRAADASATTLVEGLAITLALSGRSSALRELGRLAEAEAVQRESIAILRDLLKVHPGNNDLIYTLATSLSDLGTTLARTPGTVAEALTDHDEAVAIFTPLIAKFPEVVRYPQILASLRADRGTTRTIAGRHDEAEADLIFARADLLAQAKTSPKSPVPPRELGEVTGDLARLAARRGRKEEARTLLREAVAFQSQAQALDPNGRADRRLLDRHAADLKALDAP